MISMWWDWVVKKGVFAYFDIRYRTYRLDSGAGSDFAFVLQNLMQFFMICHRRISLNLQMCAILKFLICG